MDGSQDKEPIFSFHQFQEHPKGERAKAEFEKERIFWKENKGDLFNRQIRIRFLKLEFLGFLRFSVLFSLQCSLLVLFDPF